MKERTANNVHKAYVEEAKAHVRVLKFAERAEIDGFPPAKIPRWLLPEELAKLATGGGGAIGLALPVSRAGLARLPATAPLLFDCQPERPE